MKKLENVQMGKTTGGMYDLPISSSMMCGIATALIMYGNFKEAQTGIYLGYMFGCIN